MKVLVMGCGRIGSQVAMELWRQGHQVVVVDPNAESFRLLPSEMRQEEAVVLRGDGTRDQDLVQAGIQEADLFVAATSEDGRNLIASQKAKHIFKVPRVICRLGNPKLQEMYEKLGIVTISPTKVTVDLILNAVRQ
ncbi:MAG: TrkA family potassium uptake protein [Dehalococcoidia bacterium]|nr:TrkA family potassium uptake protein [Dehalococcoidia bacterium]